MFVKILSISLSYLRLKKHSAFYLLFEDYCSSFEMLIGSISIQVTCADADGENGKKC